MLLILAGWLQSLSPDLSFLRVVQYITFRAVAAALTALTIGLWVGPKAIRMLTALKMGQPVRGYAMQTHLVKNGTPTMGGVLILFAIRNHRRIRARWPAPAAAAARLLRALFQRHVGTSGRPF